MQTPQEKLSMCIENKHLQISTFFTQKCPAPMILQEITLLR